MANDTHHLPRNINTFANSPLDRAAHRRLDPDWIGAARQAETSLIIPFWRLQPLVLPPLREGEGHDAGWMRPDLIKDLPQGPGGSLFLGVKGERAYFAQDLDPARSPEEEGPLAGLGEFMEMRAAGTVLPGGDAAILAQAKAMIDWHARHGFCAVCGAPTHIQEAGYKRVCPSCQAEHFPRTDPVVIMLATDGERALLGNGKGWPPKMFSTLAGFVEPGESIEEAVAREVFEETGIKVAEVSYHSTQPWPFPSSLMIGCIAQASTTDITIDPNELAQAVWFDRDVVRDAVKAAEAGAGLGLNRRGPREAPLWVPPPMAISHQLIKAWAFEEG
ncbi:MAG: NAD(+) diphosphatase [Alphaproteobacteria bacterium]|nr:MAG: NAD(+) diphosphatase [Alphaproteobacteria bacterium]